MQWCTVECVGSCLSWRAREDEVELNNTTSKISLPGGGVKYGALHRGGMHVLVSVWLSLSMSLSDFGEASQAHLQLHTLSTGGWRRTNDDLSSSTLGDGHSVRHKQPQTQHAHSSHT